jgi:hypothetical protein
MESIPADVLGEFNAAGEGVEETPSSGETTIETPEPEPTEEPVAEPEVEPPAQEEPAAEPEVKAAPTEAEELPEGVTAGKNRKGEDGVFVDKKRWDSTIYANHKAVQQISEMLGEPATVEAIQLRDRAYQAQERLFSDIESGDRASQANVLNYLFDEMQSARETGRTASDPSVPFAQAFYDTLQKRSPDGYAAVRGSAARQLLQEIFTDAARSGDRNLMISAGRLSAWLAQAPGEDVAAIRALTQRMNIPFHHVDEMEALSRGTNDPLAQANARIKTLENQINGRQNTNQTEQYDSWRNTTNQQITQAIADEAIEPALSSVAEAWKPFPDDYQRLVVKPLKDKVDEVMSSDKAFKDRVATILKSASRGTAQYRDHIRTELTRAFVNRAKLAAEANRRPIIDFANQSIKGRTDANHARRQAAQTRSAPQGQTAAVPRSLVPPGALPAPKPGETYDSDAAYKLALSLV